MPRIRLGVRVNPDDPLDPNAGFPVFLQAKEFMNHILNIAKSGGGKSVWILNCICTLMSAGIAVLLIEPSGYLARDAYSASRRRARYTSLLHPAPINPMLLPYEPPVISSIVRESINQVVALTTDGANKSLTVKMSSIVDYAINACLARGDGSLRAVMSEIQGMKGDGETRDGIVSRLKFILADARMNQILCGKKTLNIAKLAYEGRSAILDCSGMSQEQMVFVGNVASQTVKSYLRFSGRTEFDPLALVIDECHNFISPNWTTILKEGRKYNLGTLLATQDLASFPEPVRRVLLNVGTIVAGRLGAQEASYIGRELHLSPESLQFMERYVVAFNTPSSRGFAKTPYPPQLPKIKPPTLTLADLAASIPPGMPTTSNPISNHRSKSLTKQEPMLKIEWFPIQPFPPPATSTPEAAPVEAHGAETPLSKNLDGSEMHTGTSA